MHIRSRAKAVRGSEHASMNASFSTTGVGSARSSLSRAVQCAVASFEKHVFARSARSYRETYQTSHGRRGDVGTASPVETLREAREVEAEMAPTENKRKQFPKTLKLVMRKNPNATARAAKNLDTTRILLKRCIEKVTSYGARFSVAQPLSRCWYSQP